MEQVSSMGFYRFPSAPSERQTSFKRTKQVRLTLGFAISSIVLGFGSALLQVADLTTLNYAPNNYLCFGVWCGILYILAGSLAVDAVVFHNNRIRMTLAAAASFVSSVFATLAAVWSIQDRLYARDHNLAAEKNTHIIEHEMRQIESDDCFADWMQAFKITMHCSVLVVSCLAVVSNMMILLIQASVLLNSKQCSLQGAFEHLFALPSFNLATSLSFIGGKSYEKERLLGSKKFPSYQAGFTHFN